MTAIHFDHFILREPTLDDAAGYCDLVLKNINRIASSAPHTAKAIHDVESTKNFLEERIEKAAKKELLTYITIDTHTNLPVVSTVIMNIDWTIPKGELGFFIESDYAGKGLMSKVVAELCKHAFSDLSFNKLFMRINDANIPSKRVAEKNNFKVEGILKNDFRNFEGRLVDVIYYGLCK
jgi:ribosomal-protein-serine acetyltransferase